MSKISIKCETCGNAFDVHPSRLIHDPPRFCSTECFYKWLKGSERAPRITVHCEACGKKIRVLKSRYEAGQGRFCSRSCVNKNRISPKRKRRVRLVCEHCNKTFYRLRCQMTDGRGRFCSRQCAAAYTIRNLQKDTPTSIERALIEELDRRGIGYEFQHPVRRWILDFAFPKRKVAVEADGSYWHSLPNVIEKDARKDRDLARRGWTVLRFGEDEINESPSDCVDRIVEHLDSLTPA